MTVLPTVEEVGEFMVAANKVRTALDLPTIEKLDYDAATAFDTKRCLTAQAFGCAEVKFQMGVTYFAAGDRGNESALSLAGNTGPADRIASALGRRVSPSTPGWAYVLVPEATAMTRAFDSSSPSFPLTEDVHALRDRLEEAGVL